jgi:putative two-component system response regulator
VSDFLRHELEDPTPTAAGSDAAATTGAKATAAIERTYAQAEIVLIEPEPVSMDSLKRVLEGGGYPRLREIVNPLDVRSYLQVAEPDLMVVDVDLPGSDGLALLADLTADLAPDAFLPILALVSSADPAASRRSIGAGAKDYLSKPPDPDEFLLRVHTLLDTRFVHLRLRETKDVLEDLVRRRTFELRQAQEETLELLSRVAELRDDATGEHTKRVGRLSGLIARELRMPADQVRLIAQAAPLHDLGKIAITDQILLKEGGFETHEERMAMQLHANRGAELLRGANSDLLRMAGEIAASHHERWDGEGYPRGLRGDEIPIAARIVAIADVFDALIHARPYKPAWTVDAALAEIWQERGWQFDPQVVDALLHIPQLKERLLAGT